MYAPAFNFKEVEGAVAYKYIVKENKKGDAAHLLFVGARDGT